MNLNVNYTLINNVPILVHRCCNICNTKDYFKNQLILIMVQVLHPIQEIKVKLSEINSIKDKTTFEIIISATEIQLKVNTKYFS